MRNINVNPGTIQFTSIAELYEWHCQPKPKCVENQSGKVQTTDAERLTDNGKLLPEIP